MLPKLTDRPDGPGQSNLRSGLAALVGILGSHVMTDECYADALMLRRASIKSENAPFVKSGVEKWPRVLEALILGRRMWYSPQCGAVENLLDPPSVSEYGDYFLLVHLLQLLLKRGSDLTIAYVCDRLTRLGYARGRIHDAVRHLAGRALILKDGHPDEDPFVKRSFPLLVVSGADINGPYRDTTVLRATPWGQYHLNTLIEQAQYWKHIFYQIVLPANIASKLNADVIRSSGSILAQQLDTVFSYLIPIEESWLRGDGDEHLSRIEVWRVMKRVRERVLHQLH
jgi:hypothetical protein